MNTDNLNSDLLPCPCCGSRVFTVSGAYEICDVCGWEDDPVQSCDSEYAGGANKLSLAESRKQWLARNGKKA